jgi:hypothetical protein
LRESRDALSGSAPTVQSAVSTTAVAAVALAADVPLEVDGEQIPLLGFAQMTLVGAVLGGLIAGVLGRIVTRPRRWFVAAAVLLTVLSCVPPVVYPPDVATKAVLVAIHLIAALIVVPSVARRVRSTSDRTPTL